MDRLFGVMVVATMVFVVGGFSLWLIIDRVRERRRRRALQRLAIELGLSYEARDQDLVENLGIVHALSQAQAEPRYAFNILSGRYAGVCVRAFDYFCSPFRSGTMDMSATDFRSISVLLFEEQRSFPLLLIHPRGRMIRLDEMVTLKQVELEAVEFARAFVVRAQDRKFAYDICHPRMMEYLLEHRDLSLEVEGRCIAMSFPQRLEPEEIRGRLDQLVEIRRLFPEYLYRD